MLHAAASLKNILPPKMNFNALNSLKDCLCTPPAKVSVHRAFCILIYFSISAPGGWGGGDEGITELYTNGAERHRYRTTFQEMDLTEC